MDPTQKVHTIHFGAKGQIVIPRQLRREYEIEAGTQAAVIPTAEGILLKPYTRTLIKRLRGSLQGTQAMAVFLAERRRERER